MYNITNRLLNDCESILYGLCLVLQLDFAPVSVQRFSHIFRYWSRVQ